MALAHPDTLMNEITAFLAKGPSPQQIVAFQPSAALSERALDLLLRHRDAALTLDERAEFESYQRMEQFLSLLKAKARQQLADPS